VLDLCQTEWDGLTTNHVRYLETLHLLGGAKGIDIVVSLLRQPKPLVLEWERLLIQKGLIVFGERGRELTQAGQDRIGNKTIKSPRRKGIEDAA
jgi:Holliday junction resolvasome RuvABC ATP-dependent DNA helicase subunit